MVVEQMSSSEVRAFGDKLEAFGKQLSSKVQLLLREILARAAAAEDRAQGSVPWLTLASSKLRRSVIKRRA